MSKPIGEVIIGEVMVGLPAMGKSTMTKDMYGLDETFVYSTDRFIEDAATHFGITYDEAFEDNIKQATSAMNTMLDVAIKQRQDIIFDQTNLGIKKRSKIINRMKQAGYQIRCSCIIPPEPGHFDDLKVWKRRLSNRSGKTIPPNIITSMYESYVEPTIAEGFDMITFYNMHGVLLGIEYGDKQ